MKFEWDPRKAASNFRRHGVSFEEALSVFADPLAHIHGNPAHSQGEGQEIIVGNSNRNRLLLVFFVEREESVRIFGARRAMNHERHDYEEILP